MKFTMQLKPQDCSPLGQFILQYMEDKEISMNQLAKKAGITQPGLRAACLRGTNPTESTLRKLSAVTGFHPAYLYALAYEDRIRASIPGGETDVLAKFQNIFIDLFNALTEAASLLPEEVRPSNSQLIEKTLKAIKSLQS